MKKRLLTLLLAACLTVSLLAVPAGAASAGFSDVSDSSTALAVESLRLMGVLDGYSDGTFRPDGSLTRAQFCKMAVYAMVPYLLSNGIRYQRNTPDMTAATSIRQANQGYYDFYLAIHSNAAGEGNYGQERGIIAFYYPGSAEGKRAAEIFADNLRDIYPLPDRVTTKATTTLGEVRQPQFPAVLIEIGYHGSRFCNTKKFILTVKIAGATIAMRLVTRLINYITERGDLRDVYGGPADFSAAGGPAGGGNPLRGLSGGKSGAIHH